MVTDRPATEAAAAPSTDPPTLPPITEEERAAIGAVLTAEYGVLAGALSAAWSASLTRTSLFLFSLSASGVALGFAAQGGVDRGPFRTLALAVLPLLLFLGVATFVRLVQVQRESIVYITGMNRIRHFFLEGAPRSRPYMVLPPYDDDVALFRSIGTGMIRRPPRSRLLYLVVQTQGIVGVVTAAVAAAFVWLAAAPTGDTVAWTLATLAFAATLIGLFTYWQRSLAELRASIRPLFPTPPDELDAPF